MLSTSSLAKCCTLGPVNVTPKLVPGPGHGPVPVDPTFPGRATPKRAIEVDTLKGVLARSPTLDDEDPACEEYKRSLDSTSSAEIQRRCGGGAGGEGGGEGGGEDGDGGESDTGDTGSDGSGEGEFSDLDGEQLAALDLPDKWNDKWFCYAWITLFGALPDVGCDMFRIGPLPPPNGGPSAPPAHPAPPAPPASPPSAPAPPASPPSAPHKTTGGNVGGRVPRQRRDGALGAGFDGIGGGKKHCGVITVGVGDEIVKCE